MPKREGNFGDDTKPNAPEPNPEYKVFRVILRDGTEMRVQAFRLFTSYDANLGLVVRALRSNDEDLGVFYAPQGWTLLDPEKWEI